MNTLKSYFTKGAFGALKEVKSHYTNNSSEYCEDSELSLDYFILITIISLSIVFGFLAVDKLCPQNSERSKNIRLGMYGLLILSGGMIGWIFILMWILNIKLM